MMFEQRSLTSTEATANFELQIIKLLIASPSKKLLADNHRIKWSRKVCKGRSNAFQTFYKAIRRALAMKSLNEHHFSYLNSGSPYDSNGMVLLTFSGLHQLYF